MNSNLKISSSLSEYLPAEFKKAEKLADQCLNKIVLLQEQLSKEEKKLMRLLRESTAKI